MSSAKPTTFRAQDVRWETFRLGVEAERQRFMELDAAGRLKDYVVSAGGLASAEVLPG